MQLLGEFRRRGVLRVAATYLVIAWLVLEVGGLLTNILELPSATMKVILGALVLGFPLALGGAWYFRLTASGLSAHDIALPDTAAAIPGGHDGSHRFDPLPIIVGVLTLGALIVLVVTRLTGEPAKPAPTIAAPAAVPANSIAVLPFDNLSGDPNQAFFSDGMSEELRGALAGVGGLRVAARTSSNAFRASTEGVGVVARKLGVAHVLDGSVRRSGKVVRVSAQLVDARTGYEQWSQTYDREVSDIFAIQTEIARTVTDALKIRLLPREAQRLAQGATASIAAHDAYLRGRQLFDLSGDEATYRAALAQFDTAIAADSRYAAAHAARARTLTTIASQFLVSDAIPPVSAAALAAADRAVALAPGLAEAQSALAYVRQSRLDLRGAREAYERSIAAGGGDADILIRYGTFNVRAGNMAKGIAALQKAVALDRFNPRAWKFLGLGLYNSRAYAEALPRQREALRLSPALQSGHAVIGDTLLMMGDIEGARAEYAVEVQGWARLTGLAIAERRLGNGTAADAALRQLIAENGDTAIYQQAQVRAQWGDRDGALAALERARAVGDPGLYYARHDPLLDPLRKSPRFTALLAALSA